VAVPLLPVPADFSSLLQVVIARSAMVGRTWIAPNWNRTAMRAHVDTEMNCEDIMLSALVWSGNGRNDPVYVEVTEKEYRRSLGRGGAPN